MLIATVLYNNNTNLYKERMSTSYPSAAVQLWYITGYKSTKEKLNSPESCLINY